MHAAIPDLDYLTARLHGRRSRLAEAGRLEALCRLRSLPELGSALYPGREFGSAIDLQRRLVQDLLEEVSELAAGLVGPGQRLLDWMQVRFQLENLKRLLRGVATRAPRELVERHLLALPRELELPVPALATAESLAAFIEIMPPGPLQESLAEAADVYGEQAKPFFLEAALDHGYYREGLARVNRLAEEQKQEVQALVTQEVDGFHLRLVSRGKFVYGVAPGLLLPLWVEGTALSRGRFLAMLAEPELRGAAALAVGHAIDKLPLEQKASREAAYVEETAALEALAWKRYRRLANAAFRRSPLGLGAVVGYLGLRRVEVANLITLSEGLSRGTTAEALQRRLIPRLEPEVANV